MQALRKVRHNSIPARAAQADNADDTLQCLQEKFLDGVTVEQCQQMQEFNEEGCSNGFTDPSPDDPMISVSDPRIVTGDVCQTGKDCRDIQPSKDAIIATLEESSKAAEMKVEFTQDGYEGEGSIDVEEWKIREEELMNRIGLLENENKEKCRELEFAYDTMNEGYETIECLVDEKNIHESTLKNLRSEMAELISKLEQEEEIESQHNGKSEEDVLPPGGDGEKPHQESNVHMVCSQEIDLLSEELHHARQALEKSENKVKRLEEDKDRIWKAHKASHVVLHKKLADAHKSRSTMELELKREMLCLKETHRLSIEAVEKREASTKTNEMDLEKECKESTEVSKDDTVHAQAQNTNVLDEDLHLRQSLSWKENRPCENENPYESLRKENKFISDHNSELSKEIDFLLRDLESYKNHLQEAEATARRLEHEKACSYSAHQAALKRLKNEAKNKRKGKSAMESELRELVRSLEVSKAQTTREKDDMIKSLESNLKKAREENSTVAEEHLQQQEELMALTGERSALQKEILELKEALNQAQQNICSLEQEDRMHDIEALQNDNRVLRDQNTALEREIDAMSCDAKRLDISLKQSATEMQRLEEEKDCLIRESQETCDAMKNKISETQKSKSMTERELRNHISSLEDNQRLSGETIGKRDTTIASLERKLQETCNEKSSAFCELAANKQNLEEVISENNTLKEQYQSIQKELNSVKCELDRSQSTAETLAEGIEHMHEENQKTLATLKKELCDTKKALKINMKNSRDLQLAQKKCSSQGEKILQQECDIWNLRKEKNALKEHNQILREKMNELETTVGYCRKDLNDSVPGEQNEKESVQDENPVQTNQSTKDDESHANDVDFLKLLNEMNTLAQHNVSLTEKVNSFERSLDDSRTMLKESESLVARLQKEKTDIQQESHSLIHYLRKDLEEANRRWVGMAVENEQSAALSHGADRQEILMLQRKNDELQQEVSISAKRVAAQGKDLELLINDLKNARSTNERLRMQVTDLKKRLSMSEQSR